MIFNLIVIVLVLLIAYMWTSQGLFSALIHLLCTIVAGAVAFAVWEPLAIGLLLGVHEGLAWSFALILPFLATLGVLRVACDKIIPANMEFDDITNFVGGGVFGLGAGVISVGVLVISTSFMRIPSNFLGYSPVEVDSQGSVVRSSPMWLPADMLTARFYELMSMGSFSTSTPLALRQPDVHEQAAALRITHDDSSRTTILPEDFTILSRYTVLADNVRDLTSDSFNIGPDGNPRPQTVKLISGDSPPAGSRIEGFVIRFGSGARESSGQIVIGPSQIRLVGRRGDEAVTMHPIAVVSRAAGDALAAGRFRFDAPNIFVPSVGGATEAIMAFEFVVPPDVEPLDIRVKNIRRAVSALPAAEEFNPAARDQSIRTLALLGQAGAAVENLDRSDVVTVPADITFGSRNTRVITTNTRLPQPIQSGAVAGIQTNDDKEITRADSLIESRQMRHDIPRQLQITTFFTSTDTRLLMTNVSVESPLSLVGRVELNEPTPILIDDLGQTYTPVGYMFTDNSDIRMYYDPGRPVSSMNQLPTLTRTRPDQELRLIYRISRNVNIVELAVGDRVIFQFSPPMRVN
ncbi:MAG: hypothetical protein EA376_09800 [Phycisphaeraceae bacterium]|nr:MAG: hypothetical protein EA376_09800 [Phycisphaeraceae bacterium]